MSREHPHGVLLTVAYDGTDFVGWQRQPGLRTVQSTLGAAVHAVTVRHSRVRGASRTDAGVHAEGQLAAFDSDRLIPPRGWLHALNAHLPDDVVVRHAVACRAGFKPNFHARGKLYRYLLRTAPVRDPLWRRRAWHIGPSLARPDVRPEARDERAESWLDVSAMREAARHLLGTHDFRAFRASGDGRQNTVRTLTAVRILPGFAGHPGLMAVEVEGTAFLKQMVRILVGTLLEVGRHKMPPERLVELLGPSADRRRAGPTAPPQGLTLVRVDLKEGQPPPPREAGTEMELPTMSC